MKNKTPLKHFNNWRLGRKLFFAFAIGAIIPIIIMQMVSFRLNNGYMTSKIDEMAVNNLIQIAQRTELTLESYANLLYQVYIDDDIGENINILLDGEKDRQAAAYSQIFNRLKQYNVSGKGIRCISIVCIDGTTITYDYKTGSFLENLWKGTQDMREIIPYRAAIDKSGMVITPTQTYPEKDGDSYIFHISKRIFDLKNLGKGTTATVIMSVDAQVLDDICEIQQEENGEEYGITFILDENRRVISYPTDMFMGITLKPELGIPEFIQLSGHLADKNVAVNEYYDSKTKWSYYYAYNKDYILRDVRKSQTYFLWIGLAVIVLSALLILYIVHKVLKSVGVLVQGMNEVKAGNLDIVVPVESGDEIGQIASNFNEMTAEVKSLIQEVKEVTNKQKNAEIRALEAQINPHFLYNTLDSINWMAIEKGEYEISSMLRKLGIILRYSVNKSNQLVTVSEMGDWLDKYISLQQIRFNHSFDYHIDIRPDIQEFKIHKLLLQPFIENAIIHGFSGIENGGSIRVELMKEEAGERLCVIIEDNGTGMSPKLVALYNNRKTAVMCDNSGIGLHNAFSRMEMYYGERTEWNIVSVEGMGTAVTLKIPNSI